MAVNVIYLHGFASSPASGKAALFKERFRALGLPLRVPDLNVPTFERLMFTAMLQRVAEEVRACPPGPVYLIGSSLGGLVALHFTDRYRTVEGARVERLFLMAPALDFVSNRSQQLGEDGLRRWRETNTLPVSHYGYNENRSVHYALYEDISGYHSYDVRLELPILIVHGKRDESVNHEQSVRFAAGRSNVDLRLVDSDHSLMDQMDMMWDISLDFFGLR